MTGIGEMWSNLGERRGMIAHGRRNRITVKERGAVEIEVDRGNLRSCKYSTVILYDLVGGTWKYFYAYFIGIRIIKSQYGYYMPSRRSVGRSAFVGRGAVTYSEFAAVCYVDVVHEATKEGAVGRGVGQSVVVDKVMYHLVDDGVVDGVGREVETRGEA